MFETLSNIGGFTGLIWQILGYAFGSYTAFHYNNALAGMLYTSEKLEGDRRPASEKANDLTNSLSNRRALILTSRDFALKFLISWFCCLSCCKENCKEQKEKLRIQSIALDRLAAEIDIAEIVKTIRLTRLLSSLTVSEA